MQTDPAQRWKRYDLEHQDRQKVWNRIRLKQLRFLPWPLNYLGLFAWISYAKVKNRLTWYAGAGRRLWARRTFGNRPNPAGDTLRRVCLETFLRDPTRRLSFPLAKEPTVSIVLLNYNHDSKLLECLSSILAHTNEVPYELIVADNASRDRGPELLQRLDGVRVLLLKENLGFVRGNNTAAKMARGKYLLLLNNDTIVTPGWLSALLDVMQRYADCGAVGPRFLYPDGRLQEAGSLVYADGRVDQLGLNGDPDPLSDLYAHVRAVDYCSAACVLVRTDFFNNRGGFDERFAPAYYEDVDLGMAVWDAGMKVFYQPSSVVIHHGPTSGKLTGVADLTTANQKKFVAKWRKRLTQHSNGKHANELITESNRGSGERVLVIAEADSPLPTQLTEQGNVVTFVPLSPREPCGWHDLRQRGIEVLTFGEAGLRPFLTQRVGCHDRIVLDRAADTHSIRDLCARYRSLTPVEAVISTATQDPLRRAG